MSCNPGSIRGFANHDGSHAIPFADAGTARRLSGARLRPPVLRDRHRHPRSVACACSVPSDLCTYDPLAFDLQAIQQGPSLAHPFGTDNFGRDVLSRVIWAYRVDMQMAFFATIFALLIGLT